MARLVWRAAFLGLGTMILGATAQRNGERIGSVVAQKVSCDPALNLVSNPGFEIGTLGASWKKATGSLVIVTSQNAYDGKYSAVLRARPTKSGSLSQTVTDTIPGASYVLTFTARREYNPKERPSTIQVTVSGASRALLPRQAITDRWATLTLPFVADATRLTITIDYTGYVHIDDFSLACKAPPPTPAPTPAPSPPSDRCVAGVTGNLKSQRDTWPCLGVVAGFANQAPTTELSTSLPNYAHLDLTDCTGVRLPPQSPEGCRTQLSTKGNTNSFQSGVWQLGADCTLLSASWVNGNRGLAPAQFFYSPIGYAGVGGNVSALRSAFPNEVFQEIRLQLTPEGYVKVIRSGEADAYVSRGFDTIYSSLTTDPLQALAFNFTTSV